MSQDEALRLSAEVVDKSSGPLKNIAAMLRMVAKEGQEHTENLGKGFGRLESGMKAAAGTATSALTPAMASIGVTALSVSGAIAGVGAAVRSFGASAKEIGQLSRDTGIAADKLREVQGILGKVGVDANASGSALQQFAENARQARDGVGPIVEFLHKNGRTGEGHEYFMGLADRIKHAKDNTEAMMLALEGLEHVSDPAGRRKYAQEVLGMADAARLADGRLGSLRQQIESFRRINGVLTPQDIKDAEDYARAMDGLKGTVGKIGDALARELTPGLTEAAKAVKGFLENERNGVQSALVTGIRDIKRELSDIDWKKAGQESLSFFRETTALAGTLASSLKYIVDVLHDLNKGDTTEALRKSTGGGGTLGRIINQYAPRKDTSTPLDEQLDAQMRGQTVTPDEIRGNRNLRANQGRVSEIEARQADINRRLAQADLLEKGGTASERSRESADALRREMTKLTEELRRIREGTGGAGSAGGAMVQQQSFEGGGTGFGGLIHRASLGGAAGVGRAGALFGGGGIVVPDGGRSAAMGGGTDIGDGIRGRPFGRVEPESGAGRSGAKLRGEDGPTENIPGVLNPRLAGSRKSLMDELDRDPALRRDVLKTVSMENRGSPSKMQAVLEAMVNRSKMNGYNSLREAVHSGFYGPVNRGGLSGALSDKDRRDGEVALARVREGSNAIGYRTDQGMLTDPGARRYMREPDHSGHRVIGGENFFYMGQKGREWARRQEAADAAQPNGVATGNRRPEVLADPNDERRKAGDALRAIKTGMLDEMGSVRARLGAHGVPHRGESFQAYLKRRAREGAVFGQRENEAIEDQGRRTIGGMNDDLERARKNSPDGEAENNASRYYADAQGRFADANYKPDRELGIDEIRMIGGRADGAGFSGAYRERQAAADAERDGMQLKGPGRSALAGVVRSGTAGATDSADRALLDVRVHNPGPNTHVTTQASGSILREIKQVRGRQMQGAGQDI